MTTKINRNQIQPAWIDLMVSNISKSLVGSNATGEIWEYTYANSIVRYRQKSTNKTLDAFYATFDGTTLSNLVAKRG